MIVVHYSHGAIPSVIVKVLGRYVTTSGRFQQNPKPVNLHRKHVPNQTLSMRDIRDTSHTAPKTKKAVLRSRNSSIYKFQCVGFNRC